jgi:4-aminobutyrate aminotransferase-like enzyme
MPHCAAAECSPPASGEDAPAPPHPSARELAAQRAELCAANVALHFPKAPLHIVRGAGAFLYDEHGAAFLDCCNNVAHVGHCQPDVCAAVCEQVRTLATNSRYLSRPLLEYSAALRATLPGALARGAVFWVNSGSEANDLALRLARAHTKRRGVLVVGGAYHGHVSSMIDASPYKFERQGGAGQRCAPRRVLRHVLRRVLRRRRCVLGC